MLLNRTGGGSSSKVFLDGEKVKELEMTSYKGNNPLTIGQTGTSFPANTLLQDPLQIVNGVSGEDYTDTANRQTISTNELVKQVKRVVADHKGAGDFVWKKLTSQNGSFVDYVVSSDDTAYPNGGMLNGYWYELISNPVDLAKETDLIPANIRNGIDIFGVLGTMREGLTPEMLGCTKYAVDTFSYGTWSSGNNPSIPHSLGEQPSCFIITIDNPNAVSSPATNAILKVIGYKYANTSTGITFSMGYRQANNAAPSFALQTGGSGGSLSATNLVLGANISFYPGAKYTLITLV